MNKRDIIAIGGSLGGLEALIQIMRGLPPSFPAAFLAVLHTSPTGPRLLAQIIGASTSLDVTYAEHGQQVQRGCLLIAPPDCHMTVQPPGIVMLDRGPKVRHARPAVDRLFESVADTFGRRAIGIVLSGGDHDGTDGIESIKSVGGIVIVQDPRGARDPHMPFNAIRDDHPNFITPIDDIGPLLERLTGVGE
ncbi:chemotaxis protein CheB [Paraburkholderia sp. BCC1884]|uniref:chemotaxis protein CheB n=1 Tax=Paraburkholderia sp. BCC1884 TaxID=2562668 RepID=UPI001182BDD0|nr:chemotaxis protein CheB [Paraburkholderia sp. BCC1884]